MIRFIFSFILSLCVVSASAAVSRSELAAQLQAIDATLPMSMGPTMQFDALGLEGEFVNMSFRLLQGAPAALSDDAIKASALNMLSSMWEEPGTAQIMRDMTDLRLGLKYHLIYDASGQTVVRTFTFSPQDIAATRERETDYKAALQVMVDSTNATCPQTAAPGMDLVKMYVADGYVTLLFEIDEQRIPLDAVAMSLGGSRQQTLAMWRRDTLLNEQIKIVARNGLGYRIVYRGKQSGGELKQTFSLSDLEGVIE